MPMHAFSVPATRSMDGWRGSAHPSRPARPSIRVGQPKLVPSSAARCLAPEWLDCAARHGCDAAQWVLPKLASLANGRLLENEE